MPDPSDLESTDPPLPSPFSEDGLEASAIRGRLATRLFGASSEAVRVGRYEVVDRIGAGGMGVVYSARDPELGRLVALKVLDGRRGRDPRQRRRLVDEARALARLSHPNVVQIHEVGEHEGSIFLALELVEGETLALWQRRPGRRWQEILAAYVDAARGLAAAHSVGVIHRDVKPSNILIGIDGRVRVVDFGLARAGDGDTVSGDGGDVGTSSTRSASVGGIAGTPAYMSPEQAAGRELDARSDVYSLCVSLFEGLFGVRPFEREREGPRGRDAASFAALRARIPRGSRVPTWVARTVVRGLEADPSRRVADMATLIAAFEAAPRRIRRRRAALAIALGLAGGIAAIVATPGASPACPAIVDTLDGSWDPATRASIRERFLASGYPFAELAWRHVDGALGAAVVAWSQERRAACVAARIEGTRSDAYLDAASECLQRYEASLRGLAARLAAATPAVVTEAHVLVAALGDPGRCARVDALRSEPAPTSWVRRGSALALRRRLDEVRFATVIADYERAELLADALIEDIDAPTPARAEALQLRGVIDARRGLLDPAARRLSEALVLAESVADEPRSLAILGELAELAIHGRRHYDMARVYADLAGAKLGRVAAEVSARADHLDRLGELALATGDHVSALARHEEALSLRAPEDLAGSARSLKGAANALAEGGDLDRSTERLLRARASLTRALGPEHPATALVDFNLALNLRLRPGATEDDLARAEALLRGALALEIRHSGEASLGAARTRVALAAVLEDRGQTASAREVLEPALVVLEGEAPTSDERMGALSLAVNLGIDRRDWPGAAAAMAALVRTLSDRGDPIGVDLWIDAGEFHLRVGDAVAATPYFDQALALAIAASPADPRALAHALNGRGKIYLAQGDPDRARDHFERALALVDGFEASDELLAELAWGSAQALVATGGSTREARRLATDALRRFHAVVPGAPEIAAIEGFLSRRSGGRPGGRGARKMP